MRSHSPQALAIHSAVVFAGIQCCAFAVTAGEIRSEHKDFSHVGY